MIFGQKKVVLSLQKLREGLEQNLGNLSKEETQQNLLESLKFIQEDKRFEFLQLMSFSNQADWNNDELQSIELENKEDILCEIGNFFQNLVNRNFDSDVFFININNPPNWLFVLENWLEQVNKFFDKKEFDFCAKAYVILFEALDFLEVVAIEKHSVLPQDVITCDMTLVKVRYLRSLYEVLPANIAPTSILASLRRFSYLGERVGLKDIQKITPNKMSSFKEFTTHWLALLTKERDTSNHDFDNIYCWLIREAIQMTQGIRGLLKLAEEKGDEQIEVYYDLIDAYLNKSDFDSAISILKRAISHTKDKKERAFFCDWLATLLAGQGKIKLALQACKDAWKYYPTSERLISWFNKNKGVLSKEDLVQEIEFLRKQHPNEIRLICMLELLIGEYNIPKNTLLRSDSIGWSSSTHCGNIVYPFLLIASSFDKLQFFEQKSSLQELINRMEVFTNFSQLKQTEAISKSYVNYLLESLEKEKFSAKQVENFLMVARTVMLDRVQTILSKRLQHDYDKVAHMLIAYLEVCSLYDKEDEVTSLIVYVRTEYRRVIAFRNIFQELVKKSEILEAN